VKPHSLSHPKCRAFFAIFVGLLFCAVESLPAAATLAWDANTEPDVAGYRLYYGASSGNYSSSIDVGNTTTRMVDSLEAGATYYFVVTAYNSAGLESAPSNEVAYTPPSPLADGDGDGLPDAWESAHGLNPSDDGSAVTESGAAGDPDHDGIPNLIEYAFDLDPQASSRQGLPIPAVAENAADGLHYLTLTYRRRLDTDRLQYTVEASADLAQWSPPDYQEIVSSDPPSDTVSTITVRLLPALESSRNPSRFARVQVRASSTSAQTSTVGQ
jgi:hypothetical protein